MSACINKTLNTDIGDRIIFLNKGRMVYHQEWFPNPSKPAKGIIFETDLQKFRIDRLNANFSVRKVGEAFFLTMI